MYGNKNHAGFIDGKCKVGGGGVGKREKRQKKIEKAVLCSSCLFQIFDKKARKMSLDRGKFWKLKFCCWIRRLEVYDPLTALC